LPEGDTLHRAARRLQALVGERLEVEAPHPRARAAIDPALLDLLHDLGARTGSTKPFEVISGYRSPATNEALRRASDGVARSSLHMSGRAIDIRLADVALPALRDAAIGLHGGGVGYYPRSDFVHVDTGRVRFW
jgi:uncharacterized protein YcbK (DUF882 family)